MIDSPIDDVIFDYRRTSYIGDIYKHNKNYYVFIMIIDSCEIAFHDKEEEKLKIFRDKWIHICQSNEIFSRNFFNLEKLGKKGVEL